MRNPSQLGLLAALNYLTIAAVTTHVRTDTTRVPKIGLLAVDEVDAIISALPSCQTFEKEVNSGIGSTLRHLTKGRL
jgi:hypothetical protein